MSFLTPVDCPRCGAPMPSDSIGASCGYCDATLALDPHVVFAARYDRAFARADALADVRVAGVPYAIEAVLTPNVSAARRTRPPHELVLIKTNPGEVIDSEVEVLRALAASTERGHAHFRTRLPQLVAYGVCEPSGAHAVVYRRISGFTHTLLDVQRRLPALDPRHVAWILRRIFELLAWVHASGFVHRAIEPDHILINARDHGVMLLGWSHGERSRDHRFNDIRAAARSVSFAPVSSALGAVIARLAADGGDAAEAERAVAAAARADFGPPHFVSLHLES